MIELGKTQELEIVRTKEFGVYLSEKAGDEAAVLLPKKQVPAGAKIGDKMTVFIYKDSSDRLIATTGTPKLELGQCAVLEVKDVAKIGAFLDMGLEKDLLLPFKEQTHPVRKGEKCLVCLVLQIIKGNQKKLDGHTRLNSLFSFVFEDLIISLFIFHFISITPITKKIKLTI